MSLTPAVPTTAAAVPTAKASGGTPSFLAAELKVDTTPIDSCELPTSTLRPLLLLLMPLTTDRGTKDDVEEGAKPSVEDRHDAQRAVDAIVILIFSVSFIRILRY